jgi:hypothetical protein
MNTFVGVLNCSLMNTFVGVLNCSTALIDEYFCGCPQLLSTAPTIAAFPSVKNYFQFVVFFFVQFAGRGRLIL